MLGMLMSTLHPVGKVAVAVATAPEMAMTCRTGFAAVEHKTAAWMVTASVPAQTQPVWVTAEV
jgi:hypothetical protein